MRYNIKKNTKFFTNLCISTQIVLNYSLHIFDIMCWYFTPIPARHLYPIVSLVMPGSGYHKRSFSWVDLYLNFFKVSKICSEFSKKSKNSPIGACAYIEYTIGYTEISGPVLRSCVL